MEKEAQASELSFGSSFPLFGSETSWHFFFSQVKTGFLYVAMGVLELALKTRLPSKSKTLLPLPPEGWN